MVGDQLEKGVRDYLERCHLTIHPIGNSYGIIPEGASQSIVELQNRLAAEFSTRSDLRRIIWIAKAENPGDSRQEEFLSQIRHNPDCHGGAEILQDNLEALKGLVIDRCVLRSRGVCPSPGAGAPVPRTTREAVARISHRASISPGS